MAKEGTSAKATKGNNHTKAMEEKCQNVKNNVFGREETTLMSENI